MVINVSCGKTRRNKITQWIIGWGIPSPSHSKVTLWPSLTSTTCRSLYLPFILRSLLGLFISFDPEMTLLFIQNNTLCMFTNIIGSNFFVKKFLMSKHYLFFHIRLLNLMSVSKEWILPLEQLELLSHEWFGMAFSHLTTLPRIYICLIW